MKLGVAMTRKNLKRAALAWLVCGVLTWSQAVYENRNVPWAWGAVVILPVMIVVWPYRLYFLTQPRPKFDVESELSSNLSR